VFKGIAAGSALKSSSGRAYHKDKILVIVHKTFSFPFMILLYYNFEKKSNISDRAEYLTIQYKVACPNLVSRDKQIVCNPKTDRAFYIHNIDMDDNIDHTRNDTCSRNARNRTLLHLHQAVVLVLVLDEDVDEDVDEVGTVALVALAFHHRQCQ
jgi:hypothetical protein